MKSQFSSEVKIDKENLENYFSFFKQLKLKDNLVYIKANLDHVLNIKFDKTLKVINYDYSNKGNLKNLSYNLNLKKNDLFEDDIKKIELKETKIDLKYNSDKKYTIITKGKYKLDNENLQNFELINNSSKDINNLDINVEFDQSLYIDVINFKKQKDKWQCYFKNSFKR